MNGSNNMMAEKNIQQKHALRLVNDKNGKCGNENMYNEHDLSKMDKFELDNENILEPYYIYLLSDNSFSNLLDSGSPLNIYCDLNKFIELKPYQRPVQGIGGHNIMATHIGTVKLIIRNSIGSVHDLFIYDCLYIPNFNINIISISKLSNKYKIYFVHHKVFLIDFNGFEIGCGYLTPSGHYSLDIVTSSQLPSTLISGRATLLTDPSCLRNIIHEGSTLEDVVTENVQSSQEVRMETSESNNFNYWHTTLAHIGLKKLRYLNHLGVIQIDKFPQKINCEICSRSKMKRKQFARTKINKATRKLEVVCSDVCTVNSVSRTQKRYFVLFIDEYSKYVVGYTMRRKSEVFLYLKKYIEFVKLSQKKIIGTIEYCWKPETIQSDHGGEFTSLELQEYLSENGVQFRSTPRHTPQLNGLSERYNQTILNMLRSVLKQAGLPHGFWNEAFRHVLFLLNRIPPSNNPETTPFEMWFEKPVQSQDFNRIHPFGCKTMFKKDSNIKLDDRAEVGFYLGYVPERQSHRVYCPIDRKIHNTRDLNFNHDIFYKDWMSDRKNRKYYVPNTGEVFDVVNEDDHSTDSTTTSQSSTPVIQPVARKIDNDRGTDIEKVSNKEYFKNLPNLNMKHSKLNDSEIQLSENDEIESEDDTLVLKRSQKIANKIILCLNDNKLEDIVLCLSGNEVYVNRLSTDPYKFEDAIKRHDSEKWWNAMKEEYKSLLNNRVWKLVKAPTGKKILDCRWVFRTKLNKNGGIDKYKARYTARGFRQTKGLDFKKTFASTLRYYSGKFIILFCLSKNYVIRQADIKTAFLYSTLDEEIYIHQPKGFAVPGKEHLVCKLLKCLYGLKQAPRMWQKELGKTLQKLGFRRLKTEPSIYIRNFGERDPEFIAITVDDLVIMTPTLERALDIIKSLEKVYQVKDMGELNWYLGFEVKIDKKLRRMTISHKEYMKEILKTFKVEHLPEVRTPMCDKIKYVAKTCCKVETNPGGCHVCSYGIEDVRNFPYREILGSLIHLAVVSRPDICYSVNVLAKFASNPSAEHCEGLVRILQYINSTKDFGLCYDFSHFELEVYVDANWNRRGPYSTTGHCTVLCGGVIS